MKNLDKIPKQFSSTAMKSYQRQPTSSAIWKMYSPMTGYWEPFLISTKSSYAENRPRAQTILENKGGISIFNGIIKEELQEVKTLFTDLLDAPLEMRSRLYYSLKILYSFTMENHPDYGSLKELLVVLSNIPGISRTSNGNNVFPLPIKSGYVVQQMKKIRKLRYLFLFPNYLIITSLKFGCSTLQYKVRNIIHLGTNTTNSTVDVWIGDMKEKSLQQTRKILNHAKDQLKTTFMCPRESRGQLFKWRINRLLKKVFKYEYFISLLLPHLRLIVTDVDNKKEYYFIFTSYFQQELWRQKLNENNYPDIEIEEFLTCIRQYSQVSQMPDLKFSVDDIHYYSGTLDVLVHQVLSLEEDADSYITLQADSFGGYFNKIHKTDVVQYSNRPVYNESFEIALCCSENMKVSLYTRPTTSADADFTLTLAGVLNFDNTSICNAYQFLLVPMYPSVKRTAAALSVRYNSDLTENKRRMSLLQWEALDYIMSMRGTVFGKSLEDISEREKRDVPLIIESCVQFIEERGLEVENIYLTNGNKEHVDELTGVFDLCSFTGALSIKDKKYSVHDVTNLLVNFLLSLAHPLLDNSKFYVSSDDVKTSERQAKVIQMLLRTLPEPNRSVFEFLMAHIVKVCQNRSKNKVSLSSICKVFGYVFLGIPLTGNSQELARRDVDTFLFVLEFVLSKNLNVHLKSSYHSLQSRTSFY
ncbi:active breakpoint cluster region-related protein-like isoform X2 [Octopus sinensis]|uniref:Active breakpoint cluster region-related protein-like isoform X2 n=1 Tax=Octopus sinensis TaxID=2607531 RepID=A0A7E6EW64_9MOLL|nr:active breakpoint cluster region-related protein-like isoform X2 [Octopus sinensis]